MSEQFKADRIRNYGVRVSYRPDMHVPAYKEIWIPVKAYDARDAAIQVEIENKDIFGGLKIHEVQPGGEHE